MSKLPGCRFGGDEPDSVAKYIVEFAAHRRHSPGPEFQTIAFRLSRLRDELQMLLDDLADGSLFREGGPTGA